MSVFFICPSIYIFRLSSYLFISPFSFYFNFSSHRSFPLSSFPSSSVLERGSFPFVVNADVTIPPPRNPISRPLIRNSPCRGIMGSCWPSSGPRMHLHRLPPAALCDTNKSAGKTPLDILFRFNSTILYIFHLASKFRGKLHQIFLSSALDAYGGWALGERKPTTFQFKRNSTKFFKPTDTN